MKKDVGTSAPLGVSLMETVASRWATTRKQSHSQRRAIGPNLFQGSCESTIKACSSGQNRSVTRPPRSDRIQVES